ncbi:neurexin-4-like isoform X2 [Amphiura filiformis]|uniref:neurexin-4-like isoform X2 n=1 Tax=Amphiura filiformis TaxID=82378 RepID=UPI003B227921
MARTECWNKFHCEIQVRTFNRDGLIIYNKGSGDGYIAIGLKDGTVSIAIKVPGSPLIEIPGEGSGLADGRWHDVRAEVANNYVKVMVNGNTEPTQKNLNIRTTADYFIGGSTVPEEDTGNMPGFRGCLRDVYLGDTMVDFLSIQEDETNEAVTNEGVDVDTCGLHDWCTPNPCEHDGQCSSDWETFICSCRGTGYAGATCHSTDKPRACERRGTTKIDVDGSGPLAPFDVDCEEDDDGTLYTIVSHDAESSESVPDGNAEPGSYIRQVMYGGSEEVSNGQLKMLTEAAEYCEQNIKYQCSGAKLLNSPNGPPSGWWVSVHNDKMNYWGGAAPNTGKCKCGMDLSCVDSSKYCNCDADDTQDQVDEGLLMDKEALPVTQLRFGDRDDSSSSSSYELGKLRCRGDAYSDKVVTFQSDEAHLRFPIATTQQNALDVSVEFKTVATGVVLLSADGVDNSFIQLELENPTSVLFQVDFGAGVKTVRATVSDDLNNNEWHRIQALLNSQEISVKVDTELPQKTAAGNLHMQLTSDLFVGSSTLQSDGYVGCMRSLFINGEFVDLTSKIAQGVIMGCIGKCTEDKCFNGGVCEEFYDRFMCQCAGTPFEGEFCSEEIGAKLESGSEISYSLKTSDIKDYSEDVITLGFTTKSKQGILLRVDDGSSGEYEEVSILSNGNLQYAFKLADSSEEPPKIVSNHDFADGRHHLVEIRRMGKELTLRVGDFPPLISSVDIADTTLSGANKIVVGSTDSDKSFIGCISRVQFNEIAPLKLYFGNRPATMRGSGSVTKSRCGVEPERPPTEAMPTAAPMPPTTDSGPTKVAIAPQTGYRPGDKAAIAIVILLLLIALVILIAFVGRYKYKHKGVYKTNEARGADNARDADTAVMMSDTKQPKFEKKKEWYI